MEYFFHTPHVTSHNTFSLRFVFKITSLLLAFSFFITPFAPLVYAQQPASDSSTPTSAQSGNANGGAGSDWGQAMRELYGFDQGLDEEVVSGPAITSDWAKETRRKFVDPENVPKQTPGSKQIIQTMESGGWSGEPIPSNEDVSRVENPFYVHHQSGDFTYTYGFVVPVGRNDLTPNLALQYSSQHRDIDSIVGNGWTLDIPYIQRRNEYGLQRMYTDQYFMSSISGELATTSTSGSFTAKSDSGNFIKYTFDDNTWEAVDKRGVTYTYGSASTSQLVDSASSTRVFRWYLGSVVDTNGNTVTYDYDKDEGQVYPTSVSYVFNSGTPLYKVTFGHEAASGRYLSQVGGFSMVTDQRIATMNVLVNNATTTQYQFGYTQSHTDKLDLLTSIQRSGFVGETETTLPATTFSYVQDVASSDFENDSSWADEIPNELKLTTHDYPSGSSVSYARADLLDINGDGLTDWIQNGTAYLNIGSGWSTTSTWNLPATSFDKDYRIGDINGDSLPDIVQSTITVWHPSWGYPTEYVHKAYINQGDGTFSNDTAWADSIPDELKLTIMDYPSGSQVSYAKGYLLDVNGDNLADWVQNGTAYLNTGSGWSTTTTWSVPGTSFDKEYRIGDINGDNMPDVVRSSLDVYDPQWNMEDVVTHYAYMNNRAQPFLLDAITNEAGGHTNVSYTYSAFPVGGTLVNPNVPASMPVVKSIVQDPLVGDSGTMTYQFEDGDYYYSSDNLINRRFSGFGKVTVSDSQAKQVSYFHQGNGTATSSGENDDTWEKIGKMYREDTYDLSDNLYLSQISTWESSAKNDHAYFVELATTTTLTYDGDGDHKDKATEYTYDNTYGNLTRKTEYGEVSASTDGSFTDTGTDKRTTDIAYAASTTPYIVGLPKQETLKNNSDTTVADTKYYYDNLLHGSVDKGNRTKTEQWISGTTWIDTEKTYNSYGLVTQEKDPRDKTTTYSYDPYNLYPATTTNPESHITVKEYDYSSGKVATTTDPNGFVFATVYDGLDRPVEEKQPDLDTPSTLVTKTAYEYTDTKTETKVKQTSYLNSATSTVSYQYLDGLGRLIQTRTEAEDANTYAVSDRSYNERGELERESLPYFSTGSASTSATTTSALFTTYTYDPLGRPLTIANAVGTTSYAYDQWETVVTDANGNDKDLHHDAFDRLASVDEHNDGSTYTTTYDYDVQDNLTEVTDALSNVRDFTYDGLGRRTEAEDLHGSGDGTYGTWLYAYDASGNVSSSTNPNGNAVNYTYDDINRPLTENSLGSAGTEVTYAYDTCTNGIGMLCSATSTGAVANYTYDALGLESTQTKTIGGENYTTSKTYDREGNLKTLTYPDNAVVKYTYNGAGQLDTVSKKENSEGTYSALVTNTEYGPHGKVTLREYANNTESVYTYDPATLYRLTNIYTEYLGGVGGLSGGAFLEDYMLLADESVATTSTTLEPTVVEQSETEPSADPDVSATSIEATPAAPKHETEIKPYAADGLVNNVHDARAWRKFYKERQQYLTEHNGPISTLEAARHAHDRYEAFLVKDGYISTPDADMRPLRRIISALETMGKKLLSMLLPEQVYAYVFGTEDFESCGSLPCSFDSDDSWGSVTSSLDHGSQVAGEDSLKEVVSGEGGGSLEKDSLSTNEIWVKFKMYVPDPLTFGTSSYFAILMLQDSSSNDTIWLNVEDWGTPRLTVAGDVLSYTNTGLDLVEGQVNTIQMRVKIGSSDGDVDIWLNNDTEGSPDYDGSGSMNTGTDAIDKVLAGLVYSPDSGVSTTYYDDSTVNDSFIGTGGGTPASVHQDISYTYDAVGNITKIIDNSETNAAGTTTYAYDDLYRLTGATTTQAASGDNYTRGLAYSAIGNITSKSDIGTYLYQGTSGSNYANPHAVTSVNGTTWTYDKNGNLTDDGIWSYVYDYRNQLTSASQGGGATTTESTVVYDDSTTWSDWSWSVTTDFDNTSPVYEGSKSIELAYTAAWGGLYLEKDTAIDVSDRDTLNFAVHGGASGGMELEAELYDDDDEWLGNVSVNDYISGGTIAADTWYDVSIPIEDIDNTNSTIGGIVIMSDTATTIYVDNIRFEAETTGGSATTTTYAYDHQGQRVLKNDGSATTTYPNKYYDTDTSKATKHIYAGDDVIATVDSTGAATSTFIVHPDHLGGTNVVTDESGDVEQLLSYYPFGATRLDEQQSSFTERNKFTGHEYDEDTNLYYMQARYQNPEVGRFVSQDPAFLAVGTPEFEPKYNRTLEQHLANPQYLNSYSYAVNNPLRLTDESGEIPPLIIAVAVGALSGLASQYVVDVTDNLADGKVMGEALTPNSSGFDYTVAGGAGAVTLGMGSKFGMGYGALTAFYAALTQQAVTGEDQDIVDASLSAASSLFGSTATHKIGQVPAEWSLGRAMASEEFISLTGYAGLRLGSNLSNTTQQSPGCLNCTSVNNTINQSTNSNTQQGSAYSQYAQRRGLKD